MRDLDPRNRGILLTRVVDYCAKQVAATIKRAACGKPQCMECLELIRQVSDRFTRTLADEMGAEVIQHSAILEVPEPAPVPHGDLN